MFSTGWKVIKNYSALKEFGCVIQQGKHNTTPPQPFYGPFLGPPGWAGARTKLLDFMVQGKINRGKHTDHLDGRHSMRTKQCPPPPSPIFTGWMPFLPPNQQCQSTEGKSTEGKGCLKGRESITYAGKLMGSQLSLTTDLCCILITRPCYFFKYREYPNSLQYMKVYWRLDILFTKRYWYWPVFVGVTWKVTGIWMLPSVLWDCCLGFKKSNWLVKNWVIRCWSGYLSGLRCK